MTRAAAFTAELIRSASRGLAGQSAALFFERAETPDERYGDDGFETWRKAMMSRLESLASSLAASDPTIFAEDLKWFRGVSVSRGVPVTDFDLAVACISETVSAQLPDEAAPAVREYFDAAAAALAAEAESAPPLAADSHAGKLFELALLGDRSGARFFALDAVKKGRMSVEEAVLEVILPAAREAGRRWHRGELGVAAEHVITSTLRSALESLAIALPRPAPNGKAAFVAAVPGDAHDTGLLAFALLLETAGWRIALAGADTPIEEIDMTAEGYDCDLIVLSATLPAQRYPLTKFLRDRSSTLPVLVGGAAVKSQKDALEMGAAGFAKNLSDGIGVAQRLVAGD